MCVRMLALGDIWMNLRGELLCIYVFSLFLFKTFKSVLKSTSESKAWTFMLRLPISKFLLYACNHMPVALDGALMVPCGTKVFVTFSFDCVGKYIIYIYL